MTAFLRDLIRIPGESCGEEGHARRIVAEMEKLGLTRRTSIRRGNAIGWMGTGERVVAFDGHIDTVGIGERANWRFDPYEGYETETEIGGRGASDQLGGIVSAVYGAKILKELGLLPEGMRVLVTGTVQEEDCDGLCWQYLYNEQKIRPEFVVITEPTDGGIYRGQRGRMEIRVEVKGVSCHGSAPERGDNAIYKMAEIILELRSSTGVWPTIRSWARARWPSARCSLRPLRAARWRICARLSVDRRLTWGRRGKARWRKCGRCVRAALRCGRNDVRL